MKIVLASNNAGKLKEFRVLFKKTNFDIIPQSQLQIPSVEETGKTFLENALLKAKNACLFSGFPSMADDSGLEVEALNGQPGIYSARYAGENVSFDKHIHKLLYELRDVPKEKRQAQFKCTLVFLRNPSDQQPVVTESICKGSILFKPIGHKGFGYDPVFYVFSEKCSMAELSSMKKNKISHRGQSMQKMVKKLESKDESTLYS